MATLEASELREGIAKHYSWGPFVASGDVGTPIEVIRHMRATVQVIGTYTGGLVVICEGSLEDTAPTNFFPLTNGTLALSFTANGGALIAENVKWVRFRAPSGSGGASATAYLMALI